MPGADDPPLPRKSRYASFAVELLDF